MLRLTSLRLIKGNSQRRNYSEQSTSDYQSNTITNSYIKKVFNQGDFTNKEDVLWPTDRDVDIDAEFPNDMEGEVTHDTTSSRIKRKRRVKVQPEWVYNEVPTNTLNVKNVVSLKDGHPDTFPTLQIHDELIQTVQGMGILEPTEIQKLCIPHILTGSSMFCAGPTGNGKTLMFLLPLMTNLLKYQSEPFFKRRGQRARAIIVVPSRELLHQTLEICTRLTQSPSFQHFVVTAIGTGHTTYKKDFSMINLGCDILITLPERLDQHLHAEHIYLEDTKTIVVDEADYLISLEKSKYELEYILDEYRKARIKNEIGDTEEQLLFVSATVSKPVASFMNKNYPSIVQAFSSLIHQTAPQLEQRFLYKAHGDWKKRLIFQNLKKKNSKRTIIFCNTIESCKEVHTLLSKNYYNATLLQGNIRSKARTNNYQTFSDGDKAILVTTDVASRGIDTTVEVDHVILYDFPRNVLDYIHRVGRTARAGRPGRVTAFVDVKDQVLANKIRKTLNANLSLEDISLVSK